MPELAGRDYADPITNYTPDTCMAGMWELDVSDYTLPEHRPNYMPPAAPIGIYLVPNQLGHFCGLTVAEELGLIPKGINATNFEQVFGGQNITRAIRIAPDPYFVPDPALNGGDLIEIDVPCLPCDASGIRIVEPLLIANLKAQLGQPQNVWRTSPARPFTLNVTPAVHPQYACAGGVCLDLNFGFRYWFPYFDRAKATSPCPVALLRSRALCGGNLPFSQLTGPRNPAPIPAPQQPALP